MSIFIRTARPGAILARGPSGPPVGPAPEGVSDRALSAAWLLGAGKEGLDRAEATDRPSCIGGPRRILVVEDSPLIAEDLALMLEDLGVAEIVLAISLFEARAALSAGNFDLALLDVSLGDARADSLLPELRGTPIVLVTARLVEELPSTLAGLPLISKPVQPEDLAALLRRYTAIASGHSTR